MIQSFLSHMSGALAHLLLYGVICGIPFLILRILFKNQFQKYKLQNQETDYRRAVRDLLNSIQFFFTSGLTLLFVFHLNGDFRLIQYDFVYGRNLGEIVSLTLALMLIHDTYFYWTHRAYHYWPWLYRFHSVHHLSKSPSNLTSFSHHPIEVILQSIWILIPYHFLPINLEQLMIFSILSMIINSWGHSGFLGAPIQLMHSKALKWMNFPYYHELHHIDERCNFGIYFRIWDLLLGTNKELPINSSDVNSNILKSLNHPYKSQKDGPIL